MATKTISITEEAYRTLVNLRRREKESFSEVITHKFNNLAKLKELHGILANKAGEELEKNIIEMRKKDHVHTKRRIKEIAEALN
jgi:predicted CopG family antitoxin